MNGKELTDFSLYAAEVELIEIPVIPCPVLDAIKTASFRIARLIPIIDLDEHGVVEERGSFPESWNLRCGKPLFNRWVERVLTGADRRRQISDIGPDAQPGTELQQTSSDDVAAAQRIIGTCLKP